MKRIYGLVLFDGLFDVGVKSKQCDFIYHDVLNSISNSIGIGDVQKGALYDISLTHLPRTMQSMAIVGDLKADIGGLCFITVLATRSTYLGALARCDKYLLGCDLTNPLHLNEDNGVEDDFCLIAYGTHGIPDILELVESLDGMYGETLKPKLRLVGNDTDTATAIYGKKEKR